MKFITSLTLCFLLSSSTSLAGDVLSIVSWNIHGGKKLDQVLRELTQGGPKTANIVHLQEVNTSDESDHLTRIEENLKMNSHHYGSDVILSRFPFSDAGVLTINHETGRRIPWVTLELPSGKLLRLYDPHLSYKVKKSPFISGIRGAEMQEILDHAQGFRGAVIVAGDLNTVGKMFWGHDKEDAIKRLISENFKNALSRDRGWTHWLVGRVDWIWYNEGSILFGKRGRFSGSDHRWIMANLFLP